jgi:predicted oxidoreductase
MPKSNGTHIRHPQLAHTQLGVPNVGYNTQGGPRRDKEARVLDPDGNPIPRLFAAGEFGSIWGFRYQTSMNVSECLVFGRIAGRNAAISAVA